MYREHDNHRDLPQVILCTESMTTIEIYLKWYYVQRAWQPYRFTSSDTLFREHDNQRDLHQVILFTENMTTIQIYLKWYYLQRAWQPKRFTSSDTIYREHDNHLTNLSTLLAKVTAATFTLVGPTSNCATRSAAKATWCWKLFFLTLPEASSRRARSTCVSCWQAVGQRGQEIALHKVANNFD